MALLGIRLLGEKVLRRKADPVEEVTDEVRRLVNDMFETMYEADGIGLAAPQVGISQRVLVIDVENEDGSRHMHALVNPAVAESSRDTERGTEGCLSIPGIEETVSRPARVTVEALSADGEPVRIEADGLLSRALQHEIDHLDGVLFIDRVSALKRSILLRKWRKSRASRREPAARPR